MAKKIIICGGHHNSALVIAESLQKKGYKVFWLGHKFSMIGDKKPTAEFLEIGKKGIPFIDIKAGKFQIKHRFIENLLRIPFGFLQSFLAVLKIKPAVVVSFGGYIALPVAFSGWLIGVPVVTHEQTAVSGKANKLIAKIARKVFVSFPESVKSFPEEKVVFSGLPIRKEIFDKSNKFFQNKKKTIYITGGKQGAHVINESIFKILPALLEKYNVIHQCGSTSLSNDIGKAEELKNNLKEKAENYLVKEYFFAEEIGRVFGSSDFVVSRAGAHTVYELLVLKKPAILIPIPWSSNDEQGRNAQILVENGLGKILSQKELEEGKLLETIEAFEKNLANYKPKRELNLEKKDATGVILGEIEKIIA
ncbi:UDP-N-acetylglucosamine--N-acetylmuramyl-(pentapeptide) pyrophosphoryl-undecaprenol N-acetylglucosamine transferase [Candidatus Microgenomates bacterium]|jgi:UDP-N-acetylglucosamine--N-acetylmuramyl-(pentapeptide) pyrophosphoryl-undecaprenol N-acetylglucosamine transferase|nr:MAG: UDP-N-acetylglucosamine--N-acetylmuramyl-(pentapeptide) pyrophosphoryl-undecaprenol N-acetylglucosamine transferase [Candidatus Microgenomates bacterium]